MQNNELAFIKESKPILIETIALIINERERINQSGMYAHVGIPEVKNNILIETYKKLLELSQRNNIELENFLTEIMELKDDDLTLDKERKEIYSILFTKTANTNIITKLYKPTPRALEKLENNIHTIVGLMCKHGIINEKTAIAYSGKIGVISESYDRKKVYQMMIKSLETNDTSIGVETLPVYVNKGQLIVIAGVGSVGKTDYFINLISKFKELGGVDFFSLELSSRELAERIAIFCNAVVHTEQLDVNNIKTYGAKVKDINLVKKEFSEWEKYVDIYQTDDYRNLEAIEQTVKKSKNQYVFIDYIGQVSLKTRVGSWEDTDVVVKALARIAKQTNKTIFAISTFNGSDKSSLSQDNFSGGVAIRHDPHVLMGLQRHKEFADKIVINVVKSRSDGKFGKFTLDYNRATKTFKNLVRDDGAKTKD